MSAKESNCKPNSDLAFNFLAIYPSKKSKIRQITDKTKTYLTSILFSTSSKTTIHPIKRLSKVIEFGKNLRFIFLV